MWRISYRWIEAFTQNQLPNDLRTSQTMSFYNVMGRQDPDHSYLSCAISHSDSIDCFLLLYRQIELARILPVASTFLLKLPSTTTKYHDPPLDQPHPWTNPATSGRFQLRPAYIMIACSAVDQ